MNCPKGEQKYSGGNRGQHNQSHIDCAMYMLARTAVFALGKVRFVVAAHFGSDAGNVISPARKNFSYDRVIALIHSVLPPFREVIEHQGTGHAGHFHCPRFKAEFFPSVRPARPASPGCGSMSSADPVRFPQPAAQLPDDYSAPTGVPILCMMHLHHSILQRIWPGIHSKGAPPGS